MALIVTLASLVLLTMLVLAFFSRAQVNRQISYSSTNLLKAAALGRSALDIITGEIRAEILDTSHSTVTTTSGVTIYQPIARSDWLPARLGVSSPTGPLIKVSANNTAIRSGGSIVGSSVSVSATSLNGRRITSSRWFTSTASSPALGSQATLPTWLFVTRGNGIKTPATVTLSRDATGNDYVIGRFAYTVYDIGGLLDANLTGYPSTLASEAAYKSSAAYADLTALGVGSSDVGNLVSWRNAVTGADTETFKEWATGVQRSSGTFSAAALVAVRSGHVSISVGDNAVLSRRDLLRNPYLSPATSAMTHFSRAINAPTYSPDTVTATNSNVANTRFTTATTSITHYRDDGSTETYAVAVGDPLVQRRFSLAKLAWLTPRGPSALLASSDAQYNAGGTAAAILSCFGLQWGAVDIGGVQTTCWSYAAANASGAIKTLAEISSEKREPNFFELLKAGVIDGSIGKKSTCVTLADTAPRMLDGNKDLQILRIGANIIDCSDTDNYPTTIAFAAGGINVPVHGVEDLPYLFGLGLCRIGKNAYVASQQESVKSCILAIPPMLFNPHRASSPTGGNPTAMRIRIAQGTVDNVYVNGSVGGAALGAPLSRIPNRDLEASTTAIVIPNASFEDFRAKLQTVRGSQASSNTKLGDMIPASDLVSGGRDIHGFIYYQYSGLPETFTYSGSAGALSYSGAIQSTCSNLLVVLEYQDSSGWHIYDSLAGNEGYTSHTGIGGTSLYFGTRLQQVAASLSAASNNILFFSLLKFDPRTPRFGIGRSGNFNTGVASPIPTDPQAPYGILYNLPFGSGTVSGATGIYPGLWAEGNKTDWVTASGSANTNVSDPDGKVRPADAWLNGDSANLYKSLTDMARRPVILQRAFRSVGELGYVFRDTPGKTLSFFDGTSGDAGLLDFFSVVDESAIVAGKVNLNTTQSLVQQALLAGTAMVFDGSESFANAADVASAYNTYAFASGLPTASVSRNVADLASFISSTTLDSAYPSSSNPIKSRRETIVRALAGNTQSRTWNLLIDVVAQTGRYPSTAGAMSDFLVEGEKRYWLSIAIDRYTGKIVARQLESMNE